MTFSDVDTIFGNSLHILPASAWIRSIVLAGEHGRRDGWMGPFALG